MPKERTRLAEKVAATGGKSDQIHQQEQPASVFAGSARLQVGLAATGSGQLGTRRRADELIRISDGRTTVEKTREKLQLRDMRWVLCVAAW